MTYDLVETFKKYFKDNKIIIDTHKINDGYYYLVKKDDSIEKLIVKDNESNNYELFEYLKIRDFYSKYLNSNKAIDTAYKEKIELKEYSMTKKICSNNIYTLFFKNKNVEGLCNEQVTKDAVPVEVFEKGIEKYYESLEKLGNKKDEKELLKEVYLETEIEENKIKMLIAFKKIYQDFIKEEKPKETWIKIFLDEPEYEYERVGNIYFVLKLFNTNDNNVKFNKKIYGVNNYNYGLNSKKPYLELKTTPYKAGSLVSEEEISIINKIYIWLYNNAIRENILKIPLNFNFKGISKAKDNINNENLFLLKVIGNNGVARIDDFEYITNFTTQIREFICQDYIRKTGELFKTENIYTLEWYTNNIWIAGNLKNERNYLRDAYYDYDLKISKSMLSNWKKEFLKNNSKMFMELFHKEEKNNFVLNLDKIGIEVVENIIIEQLEKDKKYIHNAVNAMNLWISYKKYFNKKGVGEEMKINQIQEKCLEIILQNGKIKTDEEYYYFIGQVAFYLLNKSKASKLTQDLTEPFIKATNIKKLKDELGFLYKKYNYDIYLNYPKFNNILSQLFLNEPETSVKENKDIILAGLLGNNLFFKTKKEIENGGNEDGKNE